MHEDPYEIFKMILSEKIRFPKNFDEGAKSIIRHLTDHNLSKRYGNLKHGSDDIKNHRFFKGVAWISILNQKEKPTVVPSSNSFKARPILMTEGVPAKHIPENKDKTRSPEVTGVDDVFSQWF